MKGIAPWLFIVYFTLSCFTVNAQTSKTGNSSITAEKTIIDNVEYYIHKVRSGEDLNSISKLYNISQKDVVMANPALLTSQIRAGESLYIPAGAVQTGKVEDNSFVYYVSVKGDTKSSISRMFNVSVADLDKYNPEIVVAPLKIGQMVKIPKPGANLNNTVKKTDNTEESEQLFETHTVKARETLYSISRSYNIPVSTLLELNPGLNKKNPSVKTGQKINIKEIKVETEYLQHLVQRRETIQSIAQLYKVSLNALLDINPNLNPVNPRVSAGQVIRIPIPVQKKYPGVELPVDYRKMDTIIIKPSVNSSEEESEAEHTATIAENKREKADCNNKTPSGQTIRMAVLVPLYLNSTQNSQLIEQIELNRVPDSLRNISRNRSLKLSLDPRSVNGVELCEGAMVAVEKLRAEGVKIEVEFYDTERDENLVRQILNLPELKKKDLIVGPFFSDLLPQVARFCANNHIPFVTPASGNESDPSSEKQYLINPTTEESVVSVIDRLKLSSRQNIILLSDSVESYSTLFNLYKNQLERKLSGQYKTVSLGSVENAIKEDPTVKARVIILSYNEAYVLKALSLLNILYRNQYDIQVIGLPEWRDFKNIDIEYFHNLEYTYLTPYYTDFRDPDVVSFLEKYRGYFASEPVASSNSGYIYGFMGYDLIYYFGTAISRYGKPFDECIQSLKIPMLQTRFSFTKNAGAHGYINSRIEAVKYTRDLYIERIQ
jgi:LysM repeat protein/ABC-type branched-subunit amino acid transport system substrate-binding protein